ncbi:TetR family transcriptional regulator [Streptomonospora alba]|uniref:TetR family transcriptional regulator n=1 Tax=Streptomonospora alba TaxID=183763 RepID=A0A0C2JDT4_9ACTN|nr:TetR/AcrR family transcriptional regulator [Streptomonospora alba]KIH99546.1 TetR family transcriptional regulator [Streptomonospora alba]
MPKRVDPHARRTLIADALMRVAADRGLEAVSLRHVAAEAGVTSGMVQHYFRTKEEMMAFALEVVSEKVQARLDAEAAESGPPSTPKARVRALLLQLLPLDEPRRVEGRVAIAFLAYTAVKPSVAAALRENTAQMRAYIADQVRTAQAAGEAPAETDPAHAATALLALADGLGMHALGEHYSAETALTVLDAHLDTLFRHSRR